MLTITAGWTADGVPILVIEGNEAESETKKFTNILPFQTETKKIKERIFIIGQKTTKPFELYDEAGEFFPAKQHPKPTNQH
jgi:hypothetical protein